MFNVVFIMTIALVFCCLGGCDREAPHKAAAPQAEAIKQTQGQAAERQTGAALFRQFCFNCHPDGGNVSDPQRTLRGADLRRHHITAPEDIVRIMRRPISRMIGFDAQTIPDREARAIAEYILTTFR